LTRGGVRSRRRSRFQRRVDRYFTNTRFWHSSQCEITLRSWNWIAPQFWQTIISTLTGAVDDGSARWQVSV
jgi:hypothetical protein